VTHTIADAEAAIARNPESLEQLCMATDLLIEAGDPRGEDFAACLAGTITAEEVMRRHPADVSAMYVAAWAMSSNCGMCNGAGFYLDPANADWCLPCERCGGSYFREARAEALRLLAECGKVGINRGGYWGPCIPSAPPVSVVPLNWLWSANPELDGEPVSLRMRLLDAYAQADPDTRRRWTEETRAMKPREEVTGQPATQLEVSQ